MVNNNQEEENNPAEDYIYSAYITAQKPKE
jgi:hypothetical protein